MIVLANRPDITWLYVSSVVCKDDEGRLVLVDYCNRTQVLLEDCEVLGLLVYLRMAPTPDGSILTVESKTFYQDGPQDYRFKSDGIRAWEPGGAPQHVKRTETNPNGLRVYPFELESSL